MPCHMLPCGYACPVCCFASRHGSLCAVQQTYTYCRRPFHTHLSQLQPALRRKYICSTKQSLSHRPSCVSPSSTTMPNTPTSLSGSVTEVTSAFTRSSSEPKTQLSVAYARCVNLVARFRRNHSNLKRSIEQPFHPGA